MRRAMPTGGAICVAVYKPNHRLFEAQIRSIREQSLKDWVCFVGIDGRDAADSYMVDSVMARDPRFRVIHFMENVGFYKNFERLCELARSHEWIALSDQDDYWYSNKLQVLVTELQAADATAVSGQARVLPTEEETTRRDVGLPDLLFDNQFTGSFSVFRGDVVERALPFPSPVDSSYHDHWLGVCATAMGTPLFVDVVLQDYVQHGGNVLGEHGGSLRSRVDLLRSRVTGPIGAVHYVMRHRWGWRVEMAREVEARIPESVHPGISATARGGVSVALSVEMAAGVLARHVPPARAFVLWVGAVVWRVSRSSSPRTLRSQERASR
jgi:glycosyltransferase involved in cell wall biosynthesis